MAMSVLAPRPTFHFGDTAAGGYVAPDTYDFFGVVVHEITEVMGRIVLTGRSFGGLGKSYTLMDLLHYSAAGVRDFSATTPGYFSINGGVPIWENSIPIPYGDFGDWAASMGDNPFDAFGTPSVADPVTANDLTEMDAIGWNPVGTPAKITPVPLLGPSLGQAPGAPAGTPLVPVNDPVEQVKDPAPAVVSIGLSFVAATQVAPFAEGHGGWSPGSALAAVAATGGTSGDRFGETLSGPGAASFSLNPTAGGALLAVGQQALAGSGGGTLYTMTVTATDETAATHPTGSIRSTLSPAMTATIRSASRRCRGS